MSDSFKVDLSGLNRIKAKFDDPGVKTAILQIPSSKGATAIIGQAVADNFAQQGPGWAPLKAKTIRSGVSKKLKKKLADMTDKELLAHEAKASKPGSTEAPHRMILQKSRLLMKSVTTPGAENNINRVEGTTVIWGSKLPYAGIHNKGGTIKNGFGKGITINIPKREFLVIRDKWWGNLNYYVAEQVIKIIRGAISRGS